MISYYDTKLSTTWDSKEYRHYIQVLDILEELQVLLPLTKDSSVCFNSASSY